MGVKQFLLFLSVAVVQSINGQGGSFSYFQDVSQQFNPVTYTGVNVNFGMAKRFLLHGANRSSFRTNNGIKSSAIGTSLETYNMYSALSGRAIHLGYRNWEGLNVGVSGLQFPSKTKKRTLTTGFQTHFQNAENRLERQPVQNQNIGFDLGMSLVQNAKKWNHRTDLMAKYQHQELANKSDTTALNTTQYLIGFNHSTEYEISLNNHLKAEAGGTFYLGEMGIFGRNLEMNQGAVNAGLSLEQRRKKFTLWNGFKLQGFHSNLIEKSSSTWLAYNNMIRLWQKTPVSLTVNNTIALADEKVSYLPQIAVKWRSSRFISKLHLGRFLNRFSNQLEINPLWSLDSSTAQNVISHHAFASLNYIDRFVNIQLSSSYKHWDKYLIANKRLNDIWSTRVTANSNRNRKRIHISGVYEWVPYTSGSASVLIPKHKAALSFSYSNFRTYYGKRRRQTRKYNYAIWSSVKYRSSHALIFNQKLSEQLSYGNVYFDLSATYYPKKWLVKGKKRLSLSVFAKNLNSAKTLPRPLQSNSELLFSNGYALRPNYGVTLRYRMI